MKYKEQQAEVEAEQEGMTREDVLEMLKNKRSEDNEPYYQDVFDPATAVKQPHRWVARGLKMSCEGAMHPMHQSWLVR